MKKRFFAVLASILLVAMCIGLTSCKGKYDDMKFELQYAFSLDSETWQDGSKGIDVFYGSEDDDLNLDEEGVGHLFLKVVVKNVKAKNLGKVYVTDTVGGSGFATKTLKNKEVFSIDFTGNSSYQLKISEAKSNKETKTPISINITKGLEGIEAKTGVKPATIVGGQINLAKLDILSFLPVNAATNQTETSQTAVEYQVESVGYFEDGAYHTPQNLQSAKNSLTLDGTVLKVSNNFPYAKNLCYVAKIVAKSVYKDKSASFYVYIFENKQNYTPNLTYLNGAEIENNTIDLYQNSNYNSVKLKLNVEEDDFIQDVIEAEDGEYAYDVKVYHEGNPLKQNQPVGNKIYFARTENEFSLLAITTSNTSSIVLKFKLAISGFNFSASSGNAEYSQEITVNSKLLPTSFLVDSADLKNNENIEKSIYYNSNYNNGLDLTIATQNVFNNKIYIKNFDGLNISTLKQDEIGRYYILSGSRINVKLAQPELGNSLTLQVLAVPEKFAGEEVDVADAQKYITASISFRNIVTADSFQVFEDALGARQVKMFKNQTDALNNNTQASNLADSVKLGIGLGSTNVNEKNDFYLRVYHQNVNNGASFEASSVVLYLPENSFTFENGGVENGQSYISLNNAQDVVLDPSGNFTTFRITFGEVEKSLLTTISIMAGEGTIDVGDSVFKAESVNLSNGVFDVNITNGNPNAVKIETNNGHKNFAVAYGSIVEFNVVGQEKNSLRATKDVVYKIEKTTPIAAGVDDVFDSDAVEVNVASNPIRVVAKIEEKTAVYSLNIHYYAYDNTKNDLVLQQQEVIVEFAVYVPITTIKLECDSNSLIYINNPVANMLELETLSKTNLTYRAYNSKAISGSGRQLSPSSSVSFANEGLSEAVSYASPAANALKIVFDYDSSFSLLSNGVSLSSDDVLRGSEEDLFAGTIQIQLNGVSSMDYVNISIVATSFGSETNASSGIRINFDDYDQATGLEIVENANIVKRGEDSYYIYLSFLNDEKTTAAFETKLRYESAVSTRKQLNLLYYEIYSIEQDNNGNIVTENGVAKSKLLQDEPFRISITNGQVLIDAKINESKQGGLYKLVLISIDNPEVSQALFVQISDGSVKNKFIISSAEDFANINDNADGKYFVLNQDITVDSSQVVKTEFNGNLSGLNQTLNSNGQVISERIYTISVRFGANSSEGNYSSSDGTYNYVGLFQKLGVDAVVENVNIVVANFNLAGISANADLYIGSLAGENKGRIANVNLTISNKDITLGVDSQNVYFGGLVGSNKGTINLSNASVLTNSVSLKLSRATNFEMGLIVGRNDEDGEIIGGYLGKESLNDVKYSVVADLQIEDTVGATYTVGGVAGFSNGLLSNLIVGGKISLNKINNNSNSNYLGGLAGHTSSGNSQYAVRTCAVLGLDLTNNFNIGGVAGIVGYAQNSRIEDVRVMSTIVTFNNSTVTTGTIVGESAVASVASKAENTIVELASVESFINNVVYNDVTTPFYTLYSANNTVAGLVYDADSSTRVNNSFANINIELNGNDLSSVYLTSNATEQSTYFLGRILNADEDITNFAGINLNSAELNYSVVYSPESFYYKQGAQLTKFLETSEAGISSVAMANDCLDNHINEKDDEKYRAYFTEDGNIFTPVGEVNGESWALPKNITLYTLEGNKYVEVDLTKPLNFDENEYYKFDSAKWEQFVAENLIDFNQNAETWQLNSQKNIVEVNKFNYYLPYLINNGEQLMISRPTLIQASLNQDYIIKIDSTYVAGFNYDYDITETVVVNYHDAQTLFGTQDRASYNTYKLFKDEEDGDGLINLEVFNGENDANGGVRAEVMFGNAYITNDGKNIVFTSPTNVNGHNQPVIVRCYSLFNTEVEAYVAMFAEPGLTNLMLDSSNVFKYSADSSADYVLNTFTGANATYIELGAQNIYNGQAFNTMLSNSMLTNLKLEATSYDGSILEIKTGESVKDINLKVVANSLSFDTPVTQQIVTFNLSLNLTKYFGETYFPKIEGADQFKFLKDVKLLVRVFKATSGLNVSTTSVEMDTSTRHTIEAELKTSYGLEVGNRTNIDYNLDGNVISLQEENKDSILLEFTAEEQNELNRLIKSSGSIANLFEYQFSYTLHYDNNRVADGFTYKVSLWLKDEYKYITNTINLKLKIYSATNDSYAKTVNIALTPTKLETAVINNYPVNQISQGYDSSLITTNLVESSVISPGGFGSVMIIHLQPNFAGIKKAVIRSDTITVPSVGQVSLIFQQLVFNNTIGKFQTITPLLPDEDIGENALQLQLQSSATVAPDGTITTDYSGVIYVHVMLPQFKAYSDVLTASLEITNNDGTVLPPITKPLTTEFIPSVELSFDGVKAPNRTDEYLIQTDTYNNVVTLRLYGYQFAGMPDYSFVWNLNEENTAYSYQEIEGNTNYGVIIDKTGTAYAIGDYISLDVPQTNEDIIAWNDGSYSLSFKVRVRANTPASFKLSVGLSITNDEGTRLSETDEIVFHPVNYIIKNMSAKDLNNGIIYINYAETKALNFKFDTNSRSDLSEEIYQEVVKKLGVDGLAELIKFRYNGALVSLKEVKDGESPNVRGFKEFTVNYDGNFITLTGKSEMPSTIFTLELPYFFQFNELDGLYKLNFGGQQGNTLFSCNFNIIVYSGTTEETAVPVYNEEQFLDLIQTSGIDLILMNDITLGETTPYTPVNTKIASLDGNNRVIKIKRFAIDTNISEYGLFSRIGTYQDVEENRTKQTILKNVIVDYGELEDLTLTNNGIKNVVFGGLVAHVEAGGLIYNCDVMNLSSQKKEITISVDGLNDVTATFGGLVGINEGIITNSRVGRSSYTRITYENETTSTTIVPAQPLTFNIGNTRPSANPTQEELKNVNAFVGITAGFAGENYGTITSSYVANTSLSNYSTSSSQTAGFVATNGGVVAYSYVKGSDTQYVSGSSVAQTKDTARDTSSTISNRTNGHVAGFVYLNEASINNCYANIKLETQSAYLAGFVYRNGQTLGEDSAVIEMCYSACQMNANSNQDAAEQPFVGASEEDELLSFGQIDNCYYLQGDYVIVTDRDSINKPQAASISFENFMDGQNLINFVFIPKDPTYGVWYYPDYEDTSVHSWLPDLTGANQVAHSYRHILNNDDNTGYSYTNAKDYEYGSVNNPYIIRDVEEYNSVMTNSGSSRPDATTGNRTQSGYFRLINNINFEDNATAISTRTKFVLGNGETPSSIEGNGLTISGIYLDVTGVEASDRGTNEIGLFAKIENSYIKNLNLSFRDIPYENGQFSTVQVPLSGGLAGSVSNSGLINITLNGSNSAIAGRNLAGGLAGLIKGDSYIYNITSSLSARADYIDAYANLYYSADDFNTLIRDRKLDFDGTYEQYLRTLSFAGGVAGVVDINPINPEDYNKNYNISNINVLGYEMQNRADGNIFGMFAGGVAGYVSKSVNALRLRYYTGKTDLIYGQTAAGGIYGFGQGSLTASQVTTEEDAQYEFDKKFGEYIIGLDTASSTPTLTKDVEQIGNLKLLSGYNFVGGLVGIGINQAIANSYSKIGVKNAAVFGGAMGLSVASSFEYVYSIPYINLDDFTLYTDVTGNLTNLKVGGLIGAARKVDDSIATDDEYYKYIAFAKQAKVSNKFTDMMATFSTVILDANEVGAIINSENDARINWLQDKVKFDYICPDFISHLSCQIQSNGLDLTDGSVNVFYGRVNNYPKPTESNLVSAAGGQAKNLHQMFDIDDVEQEEIFVGVFSSWPTQYWNKNRLKFFPLLIKDEVEDYIIIEKPQDFDTYFNKGGDEVSGNYKIVDDINMEEYEPASSNWIFNINFTGTLIGERQDDSGVPNATIPRVYNLRLNPTSKDTSGLFMRTTGAQISFIDFVWYNPSDAAISMGANITTIGGVSCDDNGSEFTNLGVYSASYDARERKIKNETENSNLINSNAYALSGFGGIVADGTNSTVISCHFEADVAATLSKSTYTEKVDVGVNVGAIVGYGIMQENDEDHTDEFQNSLTITGSTIGKSKFNLTLKDSGDTAFNIGGAVGYSVKGAISQNHIGEMPEGGSTDKTFVDFTISVPENCTNSISINYGGLIGKSQDSVLANNETVVKVSYTSKSSADSMVKDATFAGLIGYYSQTADRAVSAIRLNSTYAEMDLSQAKVVNMYVAGGIGQLFGDSNINIEQCIFTGNASCEQETSAEAQVTNVYGGGIIAYAFGTANNGIVNLSEIVSTFAQTLGFVGSTNSVCMGGFVGYSKNNLVITNCVTAGRLVPITDASLNPASPEDPQDVDDSIVVGGMVGTAKTITISYSISTSSIIADSIAAKAIRKLEISALVGRVSNEASALNFEQVYYSSDISLFPDEHAVSGSYNLSAAILLNKTDYDWAVNFVSTDAWVTLGNGMPVLGHLNNLYRYNITSSDGYVEGSSLNPIYIQTNEEVARFDENDNYTYYLLSDSLELDGDFAVSALNGVLIGGECEYSISGLTKSIVGKIGKHSAISNLHIKLSAKNDETETEADNSINLQAEVNGLVASTNNGSIFNCSVQGTGLSIRNSSQLGLIAGLNNGMVAFCYSSAEIIEIQSSFGISGIVDRNAGKILSCYFTGFINNNSAEQISAGIVNSFDASNPNYVYNCYSAGVITYISSNILSATAFGESGDGSNNFIDINANKHFDKKEKIDAENPLGSYVYAETVETNYLMYAKQVESEFNGLKGNWLSTVNRTATGAYYVDTNTSTYGYNYFYPIYNFNKSILNGSVLTTNVVLYQLYTGTGTDKNVSGDDVISYANDQEKSYNNMLTNKDGFYTNAIKVPHLGVLKAVQGLANTIRVGEDKVSQTNLNYVLIYDIDGLREVEEDGEVKSENYEWSAIGTTDRANTKFITDSAEFNGVFISNKYYNYTDTGLGTSEEVPTEPDEPTGPDEPGEPTEPAEPVPIDNYICTVRNLSTQGLFDNIGDVYIGYIKFGNMYDLKDSGALGVGVVDADKKVNIFNIIFESNATISGSREYVGAFFGEINTEATINIKDSGLIDKAQKINICGAGYAGFLAGSISSGTVNLDGCTFNVSLYESKKAAGGLVGLMSGGSINGKELKDGSDPTVSIKKASDKPAVNLGGFVGVTNNATSSGEDIYLSNVAVEFDEEPLDVLSFGGLVFSVEKPVEFVNCRIDGASLKVNLASGSANHHFGLLASAIKENGEMNISSFCLTKSKSGTLDVIVKTLDTPGSADFSRSDNAYGVLVGCMYEGAGAVKLSGQQINVRFSTNGCNVGGMVGYMAGGSLALNDAYSTNYKVEVQGYCNVGGAIGYVSTALNTVCASDSLDVGANYWDFLTATQSFATLKFQEDEDSALKSDYYNWGGLFGFVNAESSAESNFTITNNNSIFITAISLTPQETNSTLTNVGGVAGKIVGACTNLSLENKGEISYDRDRAKEGLYYGVDGIEDINAFLFSVGSSYDGVNFYFAIQAINVGGIFGYANNKNSTPSKMSNSKDILGYQNVGGLVGYLTGSTIGVDNYVSNGFISNGKIFGVVNVGGSVGAASNSRIIYTSSTAKVYGNYNVGGLVGYLSNSSLRNNSVGDESADTFVKGINFYPVFFNTASEEPQNVSKAFIPTNVGGLFGSMLSGTTNTVVTNNKIQNISITTTKEGQGASGVGFAGGYIISTVSNPNLYATNAMVVEQCVNLKNIVGSFSPTGLEVNSNYMKSFYSKDGGTGIGGFAGSISSKVVMSTDFTTNVLIDVKVDAGLGINVGTFYGYYLAESSQTSGAVSRFIQTPQMDSDLFVSGNYFVGGIAGFIETQQAIGFSTDRNDGYFTSNANRTITIQGGENNVGMYVGGLFGRLRGNANGLKITGTEVGGVLKIKINNSSSTYVGGLIGRLEGNLGGADSLTNSNIVDGATEGDSGANSKPLLVVGDDKGTFGGLVGMLKLEKSSRDGSGTTANVIGWQPFAFTVNTIENSNYYDGETQYGVDTSEPGKVQLTAQAYYANLDTFNISYSRGSLGGTTAGEEVTLDNSKWFNNDSNNPLNSLAHGWAKEYTMFKTIQRNIPIESNNGAEWDSISPIYDASNITAVGTIGNLGLENDYLVSTVKWDRDEGNGWTRYSKTGDEFGLDYICYTVYDEDGTLPKLYSRIGVASAFTNSFVIKNEGQYAYENYDVNKLYLKPIDDRLTFMKQLKKLFTGKEDPSFYYIYLNDQDKDNRSSHPQTQGLTYFQWDKKQDYLTIGDKDGHRSDKTIENTDNFWDAGGQYKSVVYYVDNYLHSNDISDQEYEYVTHTEDGQQKYGLYFVFGILYDNDSLDVIDGYKATDDQLPADGCIFNVSGVLTSGTRTYWEQTSESIWSKILGVLLIVIEIFVDVVIFKGFNPTKFIKVVKAAKWFFRIIMIFTGISLICTNGSIKASQLLFQRSDMSMGYMHGTYTRQINYQNNLLNTNIDEDFTWGDLPYYPYSSIRPSDYYNNYYYFISGDNVSETSFGEPISKEVGDAVLDSATKINTSDDGYYYDNVTIEGQDGSMWPKYVFDVGTYYINSLATEMVYSRVSGQLNTNGRLKYNDYYQTDMGEDYVRGKFDGTTYSFSSEAFSDNQFNMTPDGNATVNGVPWEQVAANYGLDLSDNVAKNKAYFVHVNKDYITMVDSSTIKYGLDDLHLISYNYGYGYMKNAYYTANGTKNVTTIKRVGVFKYVGTARPTWGTQGVDYLEGICNYGEDVPVYGNPDNPGEITGYNRVKRSVPVYYVFNGVNNAQTGKDSVEPIGNESLDAPYSSYSDIYINLYPKAFINPYDTSHYTTINWSNLQDSEYYINNNCLGTSQSGIEHEVTYYFYEGGYKSKAVFDDQEKDTFYTEMYHVYYNENELTDPYGVNQKFLIPIPIYDYNGDEVLFTSSTSKIKDTSGNGKRLLLDVAIQLGNENPGTYYTVSRKELGLSDDEVSWKAIKAQYLIENQYIMENGTGKDGECVIIYHQSNEYVIKDGLLSSYRQAVSNYDYNVNKYLINKQYDIYTRYKYLNDDENMFKTGIYSPKGSSSVYYLFRPDGTDGAVFNNPNPDSLATYLTESVCVTLGGGSTYIFNNLTYTTIKIGYINAK